MGSPSSDQTPGGDGDRAGIADLSERQYACLRYAGEGMSSKQIGRLLGISPSTVDNHIHVAITKLNARNRWHAAQLLHPNRMDDRMFDRRDAGAVDEGGAARLPPVGGRPNIATPRQRVAQILTIAATSLIGLSAAVVLVLGAIDVFGGA